MKPTEAIRNDDDSARRHNLIKAAAAQVEEHFDSVLVIATVNAADGGTYVQYASKGNCYANIGAAERWLTKQKNDWSAAEDDD